MNMSLQQIPVITKFEIILKSGFTFWEDSSCTSRACAFSRSICKCAFCSLRWSWNKDICCWASNPSFLLRLLLLSISVTWTHKRHSESGENLYPNNSHTWLAVTKCIYRFTLNPSFSRNKNHPKKAENTHHVWDTITHWNDANVR